MIGKFRRGEKTELKSAQKQTVDFVKFVHTYFEPDAIIIIVKPPNTLYSFCYTPFRRNTFSKKGSRTAAFFRQINLPVVQMIKLL